MTTYERLDNRIQAQQWDGTAEGLTAVLAFVGDLTRAADDPARVVVGVTATETAPVLMFRCAKSGGLELGILPGGAVAAERDGSGFYPIAPDVLAADFRPVAAGDDDASPPAARDIPEPDVPVTDDELEAALAALEADQ